MTLTSKSVFNDYNYILAKSKIIKGGIEENQINLQEKWKILKDIKNENPTNTLLNLLKTTKMVFEKNIFVD